MRLPLIVALAAIPSSASAQNRAASWVAIHASSDNLVVVSPQVTARASIHAFDLQAGWDADVITGATVDVRSSASPRAYTEMRQGITLGTAWRPETGTSIGVRYTPSWEPDYTSETFSVSASRDFIDRRLTTEIGVRGAFDRVGRVSAPRDSWSTLDVGGLQLGAGWVFDPRTVGSLALEAQLARGFQSSPYRVVRIAGFGAPEHVPESRDRLAVAVGLRRALAPRWFASGTVRLYDDTWSLASHSEEIDLAWAAPRDRWVVGASARFYGQSAASFYRFAYGFVDGGVPLYRTADKMLAPSMSVLGGLRASIAWHDLGIDELRATLKMEIYEQRLFDFTPLTSRGAAIVSLGLAATL